LNGSAKSLPVIAHVQVAQRDAFEIFRTSAESLPTFITEILRQPIYGSNWSLAQRLPVRTMAKIWAVPGNGFICLVSIQKREPQLVGMTCDDTADTEKHGLFTAFLALAGQLPHRLVVGIAPDGFRQILIDTGKNVASVPVSRGVFVRRDGAEIPPDSVELISGRGGTE
jgi:hypothetical protein